MIRRGNLEDFDILFKWINDEDTIKFSKYGKCMDLDEFNEWFENRINNMLVMEEDLVPLGQICYEILDENNEAIINYCVDKDERSKGYGKELVKHLINLLKNNDYNIRKLSAYVHKDNIQSIKIFESLNFNKEDKKEYFKFYINL